MTDDPNVDDRPGPARLGQIADVFIRYGNFTLGGGSATTAVMHGQLVTKRGWLNDKRFTLCFALGRLTPETGPDADAIAGGAYAREK